MRAWLALFLAAGVLTAHAGDAAKRSIVLVPMFADAVVFSVPPGWQLAHQMRTETQAILEFVPEGQTVQAWREMITVRAFKDPPRDVTPKAFLEQVADRLQGVCPGQAVAASLGDTRVDSHPAHGAILGCGRMPAGTAGATAGQGEVAYYLALRGSGDFVVAQRAVRGRAFDRARPPVTPRDAAAMREALQPLKVCSLSEPAEACRTRAPR